MRGKRTDIRGVRNGGIEQYKSAAAAARTVPPKGDVFHVKIGCAHRWGPWELRIQVRRLKLAPRLIGTGVTVIAKRQWANTGLGWKLRSGFMRNRIFGAIGIVWGGLILLSTFFRRGPQGSGSYAAGQNAALGFAVLLVLVGGYYVAKGGGRK